MSHKIKEYLRQYMPQNVDILIITETIARGDSLQPLSVALREENISYDIASLSIEDKPIDFLEEKLDSKIYAPEHPMGFMLAKKPELSGVRKEYGNLRSEKIFGVQETVNEMREDAHIISDSLVEFYREKSYQKKSSLS
jgi:hypothetical protein